MTDDLNENGRDDVFLAGLLSDPSVWAEPGAELEDRVVASISEAAGSGKPAGRRKQRRRTRRFIFEPLVALAAAAAVLVVGVVVLTRDDDRHPLFKARLAATELAPGSHGSVDVYRNNAGFRLDFDATGLPLLDHGQYYQAWLKNTAGTSVPIGTFSSGDDEVILWSGVSPKDFPTFSVTIEATDGDQSSSHRVVLAGPAVAE